MANNHIEFRIGSKFSGEGFQKLQQSLKHSKQTVGDVTRTVSGVLNTMDGNLGAIGKTAQKVGGILQGALSFGVWGAAIAGATELFRWLEKMAHPVDEVTQKFREQLKHLKSMEHAAEGYQKRVEGWKKQAREREDAEKKAAAARKAAIEKQNREADEAVRKERERDQLLMKRAEMVDRLKGVNDDQLAINNAKRGVEFAQKWGGTDMQKDAELALKLAERQAAVRKRQRDEEALERAAKERDEICAEQQKLVEIEARKRKEEEIARARIEAEKRIEEIDKRIAEIRKESAALQERAANAKGVDFQDWLKGERDRAKDKRVEDRKQDNRERSAQQELDRLQAMNPRTMTDWQKSRLKKLKEWAHFQGEDKSEGEVSRLEKGKKDDSKPKPERKADAPKPAEPLPKPERKADARLDQLRDLQKSQYGGDGDRAALGVARRQCSLLERIANTTSNISNQLEELGL